MRPPPFGSGPAPEMVVALIVPRDASSPVCARRPGCPARRRATPTTSRPLILMVMRLVAARARSRARPDPGAGAARHADQQVERNSLPCATACTGSCPARCRRDRLSRVAAARACRPRCRRWSGPAAGAGRRGNQRPLRAAPASGLLLSAFFFASSSFFCSSSKRAMRGAASRSSACLVPGQDSRSAGRSVASFCQAAIISRVRGAEASPSVAAGR